MKSKMKGRRFFPERLREELKNAKFRKAYEEADLSIQLAIQIAKLREKKGLSQKTLARKIGTQQQVISRIESFEQRNLTLGTLQRIAEAFNARLVVSFR